jgi:hypothetical protein
MIKTLRVSATLAVALGAVALVAGCATSHGQAGASTPTPAATSSDSPPLDLTPGGTFATQAAAPGGHIDQTQALTAAKAQVQSLLENGGVTSVTARDQVSTAASTVRTQSYGQLLSLLNNPSGHQLATGASVREVRIDATVPAESLPSAAGATRTDGWKEVSVAYDARTGLTLWEGPTPIATMNAGS